MDREELARIRAGFEGGYLIDDEVEAMLSDLERVWRCQRAMALAGQVDPMAKLCADQLEHALTGPPAPVPGRGRGRDLG